MVLSQDLDDDIFGPSYDEEAVVEEESTDILGEVGWEEEAWPNWVWIWEDITWEVEEEFIESDSEPVEWAKNEEALAEVSDSEETTEDAAPSDTGDDELNAILAELDEWTEEIEEKIEEVKDEAVNSWNQNLIDTIDELQTMLAEKGTKVIELTKQLETTNTSYLDKVWEAEGLSIYKNVIENLETNPNLMLLAKYHWSDNEKIQWKLINIVSDLVMEYTGEDISALINQKQSDAVWDLWDDGEWMLPAPTSKQDEPEEDWDYEKSVNDLF